MRLWSLHPRYLDAKGLVALWREALLAQKVIAGATVGYRHHPQLRRFQRQSEPFAAIAAYLQAVFSEAQRRGYHFDPTKIAGPTQAAKIAVTTGQMDYELNWLKTKLRSRDPDAYRKIAGLFAPEPHPLFYVVAGAIEEWEVVDRGT